MLITNSTVDQFLNGTVLMPERDIETLLHAKVNVKEVGRIGITKVTVITAHDQKVDPEKSTM